MSPVGTAIWSSETLSSQKAGIVWNDMNVSKPLNDMKYYLGCQVRFFKQRMFIIYVARETSEVDIGHWPGATTIVTYSLVSVAISR